MKRVILLVIALMTSATSVAAGQSAFFEVVLQGEWLRVTPKKNSLPYTTLQAACRNALSEPLRIAKQQALATELKLTLPETIAYAETEISHYIEKKESNTLLCKGDVVEVNIDYSKSVLALMNAWWYVNQNQKSVLKSLLRVAMTQPDVQTDAIVLIATQIGGVKGFAILSNKVGDTPLILPQSQLAASQLWMENNKFKQALSIITTCQKVECNRLRLKIINREELYDEKTVDDLSSYF
ncbi:MAG: hypothetical protein ACI8SC_000834 [Colwellia sp.]